MKITLNYINEDPKDCIEVEIPLEDLSQIDHLQIYFNEFLETVKIKESRKQPSKGIPGPDGNCNGY